MSFKCFRKTQRLTDKQIKNNINNPHPILDQQIEEIKYTLKISKERNIPVQEWILEAKLKSLIQKKRGLHPEIYKKISFFKYIMYSMIFDNAGAYGKLPQDLLDEWDWCKLRKIFDKIEFLYSHSKKFVLIGKVDKGEYSSYYLICSGVNINATNDTFLSWFAGLILKPFKFNPIKQVLKIFKPKNLLEPDKELEKLSLVLADQNESQPEKKYLLELKDYLGYFDSKLCLIGNSYPSLINNLKKTLSSLSLQCIFNLNASYELYKKSLVIKTQDVFDSCIKERQRYLNTVSSIMNIFKKSFESIDNLTNNNNLDLTTKSPLTNFELELSSQLNALKRLELDLNSRDLNSDSILSNPSSLQGDNPKPSYNQTNSISE